MSEPDPIGSAAEEALKLLRALAAGARDAAHLDEAGSDAPAAGHTCPNGWCPVCRVAEWVRDDPEIVDSLTDAAVVLARSVRDVLDTIIKVREHPAADSDDAGQ